MSRTSSVPFSLASIPSTRRLRVLKTHIVIHILIFSTAIVLLILLISHTAAAEAVEDYGMPLAWKKKLIGRLMGGTKVLSWVAIYLVVPLDVFHASLCIGWYANRLHPVRRERDVGKRRRATRSWLEGLSRRLCKWWNRHLGHFEGGDGEDDSQRSGYDIERLPPRQQSSPHDRASSQWTNDSDAPPRSPTSSLRLHTYHPFLHPAYTTLSHHILLTLWDIIMLLALASYIYVYIFNILPGLAFCTIHKYDFAVFSFTPDNNPFSMPERCKRINWGIHSAGGCAATGATFLALWHFCALVFRLWSAVDKRLGHRLKGRRLKRWKGKLRARRGKNPEQGIDMLDWQYPPRDVDVRSRSTMRRSARSETQTGTQTGVEDVERRGGTLDQEEMGTGMTRRKRRRRVLKSDANNGSDGEKDVRGSKWSWRSEGFLEFLA